MIVNIVRRGVIVILIILHDSEHYTIQLYACDIGLYCLQGTVHRHYLHTTSTIFTRLYRHSDAAESIIIRLFDSYEKAEYDDFITNMQLVRNSFISFVKG